MAGRRKIAESPDSEKIGTTMASNNMGRSHRTPRSNNSGGSSGSSGSGSGGGNSSISSLSSTGSTRNKKGNRGDHVGNGIIPKYTAYLKERPYIAEPTYTNSPFSREEELFRKLLESDRAAETPPVQGVFSRINHTINTNTNNTNNYITNVSQNKFFLFCLIILIIIAIYNNNRNYSDNSPLSKLESFVRFQFWQTDNNTFKIKHIVEGENNVSSSDDNDTVLTIDDLKAIIMDEVKSSCVENSSNVKSNEPNPDLVRSIINSEVKLICSSMLKKEASQIKSETQRYRGKKQEKQELLDLIRREAKDIVLQELLVFSQDKLNRPDFALHSGGAKVISRFTSKTYELWPEKWYQRLFAYVSGQGVLRGKPPVTAISPDINVGQCWPFPGQDGQIAVLLNRRVYVTAVTYDHVSKRVAVDVLSAPKEFEVWGIIDDGTGGRTKNTKHIDYEDDSEALFFESKEEDCGFRQDGEYEPSKNNNNDDYSESKSFVDIDQSLENITTGDLKLGTSSLHLFLGRYTYDIEGLPIQTFEIPLDLRKDNQPVRAVIMKINSNWGKPGYTCLYRFRVHGDPVEN